MADADRFFDAESGAVMRLQLEQSGSSFKLLRKFGYRDPRYPEPFVIPADLETFETDLASIPLFWAWLVPGLGSHLPAVLLHDGLVVHKGKPPTHSGPPVDREEADRILRDAMASLGVPKIRRWIMWTAVILATAWSTLRPTWRWRALVLGTLATVALLGTLATLDLLDIAEVLPWMGDRAWWLEVIGGGLFGLLVPLLLSRLWGRLWAAGAIAGVALAFLFHVTVVILFAYGIYWLSETVLSRAEGTRPDARRSFLDAVASAPVSVPAEPQISSV